MKFYSSRFEEYISENKKYDIHTTPNKKLKFDNFDNLIIYGPSGIGKYTQALRILKDYSPTNLKYERKFNMIHNKKEYLFKISDIHVEIDMELLGCNAKSLFNDIYYHILNVFSITENKTCIILCKNFHAIHNDLLNIFYSYMQSKLNNAIKVYYFILTEHLSFIPSNILNISQVINYKRPNKTAYNKLIKSKKGKNNIEKNELCNINNIKDVICDNIKQTKKDLIIKDIISEIDNYNNLDFMKIRELLYNLFIYNFNIIECLYDIINHYINETKINDDNANDIFIELFKTIKLYNNNYRPIFHLEKFIYYIIIKIHEL